MARSTVQADILAQKICAEQFGLISSSQLRGCGLTRQAIHRRVQSGRLSRVNASVFKCVSAPDHELSSVMAAVLSVGDVAVISHTTAAALRGLDGFHYEPIHVSVTRRLAPRPGVILHKVDDSLDHQKTMVENIPTTTPVRTLLDLASTSHPLLEKALDEMIRRGMVVVADMWELIESPERWGRKGTRILADLMRSPDSGSGAYPQ
jgi:predicted transcriptional regulator of viral defense system